MKREESRALIATIVTAIRDAARELTMDRERPNKLALYWQLVFDRLPAFKHPFTDAAALATYCNGHGAVLWRNFPLGWRIERMDHREIIVSFPNV